MKSNTVVKALKHLKIYGIDTLVISSDVAKISVSNALLMAEGKRDKLLNCSNVKPCPLCKQRVILNDFFVATENKDDRFKEPCNKCINHNYDDDEYPCRWCTHN